MSILHEIYASEEDLKDLKGMSITNIENFKDSLNQEGVVIELEGEHGGKVTVSITDGADGTEFHRSAKQFPLYIAQDLRDYEGYTIKEVQSDDNDLNSRVILEGKEGNTVTLIADKALDGETLFIEEE